VESALVPPIVEENVAPPDPVVADPLSFELQPSDVMTREQT
jgi:hypothetical protein